MASRELDDDDFDPVAWSELMKKLLCEKPTGDELSLAKTSVVLACLETGYRSGGRWAEEMKSVAMKFDHCNVTTWEEVL